MITQKIEIEKEDMFENLIENFNYLENLESRNPCLVAFSCQEIPGHQIRIFFSVHKNLVFFHSSEH